MLVVILFLQTWRAAIIPIVAIPVSLIGTFFFMAMFGFTLNNLSLFGLVLAVGIVVDDAIVVVENVERNIAAGLSPARGRASRAWTRSARALIAIALVLCAVFVPSAFITGISGQFYRQFALTIAGATVISLIVSLTLSPALCALLLKPHDEHRRRRAGGSGRSTASSACSTAASTARRAATAGSSARVVRFAALMLIVYAGVHRLRPQRVPQDAGRLHPAARPRLPDHRRRSCRRAPRSPAPTRSTASAIEIALAGAGRRAAP